MSHTSFVELRAAGILKDPPAPPATEDRKPYVGMPATYRIGSDAYAGKITEVLRNGKTVVWTRTNDATGELVPGFTNRCTLRRFGRYIATGGNHGDLKLGVA